ncbi:MAG: N-acetylmuramoyl-L-alanine amidase [Kiloniellales bacterium]
MIERPSLNHGPRRPDAAVDILVLHYTGMASRAEALDRLCDPAAKVSAHYLIDEDGTTYRLVPEARRAWHAGAGSWAGDRDVNGRSIGIELVNPGHALGYRRFPEAQITALIALARGVLERHPIPPGRVLGHSDVAPGRRLDPGELFPWAALAGASVGLWPEPDPHANPDLEPASVKRRLAQFGYAPGHSRQATVKVIEAFQRHFRPRRIDGAIDRDTVARLDALLALVDRGDALA